MPDQSMPRRELLGRLRQVGIEIADVSADGLATRARRAKDAMTWDGAGPVRVY